MLVPFESDPDQQQLAPAARELAACNEAIGRHGLSLSMADAQAIVVARAEALAATDRVEFGGGVASELVLAFAGSPHVSQATFADTIIELQDLFYEFKNESLEQITDDDLIAKMRSLFDDPAEGNLAFLEEALFEGLARTVREETVLAPRLGFHDRTDADKLEASAGFDDAADPDADNAAANAHTLAAHRYDIGEVGRRQVRTRLGGFELARRVEEQRVADENGLGRGPDVARRRADARDARGPRRSSRSASGG